MNKSYTVVLEDDNNSDEFYAVTLKDGDKIINSILFSTEELYKLHLLMVKEFAVD